MFCDIKVKCIFEDGLLEFCVFTFGVIISEVIICFHANDANDELVWVNCFSSCYLSKACNCMLLPVCDAKPPSRLDVLNALTT